MQTLPAFPPEQLFATELPERLRHEGYALRWAVESDAAFLRELYAWSRAEEMAQVVWPEGAKDAFLDSQFALQHRHFVHYFAQAEFLVLEHRHAPVGRLYVSRQKEDWLVVDIGLMPAYRGKGVGSALLQQLLAAAERHGARSVALHVEQHNVRAHKLYRELGFRDEAMEGFHQLMRWQVPAGKTQLNTA
ncbi:GNAT family N-acetyltransferase [Dyella acidiphila]|uniref:GNAT family N-acetyltransferase n=1 Tax=Dyella acidiphila TaxID=2775866 RepID=A0ABR9GEM0_9GAMM|nr:GNAT family N-acetyltransferase [Dyella acidiphila]